MKLSLGTKGGTSLKRQILIPAIAAMVIGTIIYSIVLVLGVISQNNGRIQEYRDELISRKKEELKNYTDILFKSISGRPEAQVIAITKQSRYADTGYFWIN